jgi:putative transposase
VWREGAAVHPPQLKANMIDVDAEFSNIADRSLQHYGIDLHNFVYTSPELLQLRRMLRQGQRVDVKWPAADAGYILVFDPLDKKYIRVPNKDPQYAGLTVEQAKHAYKTAAAGDPSYKYMGAKAAERINEMVETARKSKKLKDRRKAARFANDSSEDARKEPGVEASHATAIDEALLIETMPIALSWDEPAVDDADVPRGRSVQ